MLEACGSEPYTGGELPNLRNRFLPQHRPTGRAGKAGVPNFSVGNTIMKGVPDHGPNIFGQKSVEAKRKAMTLEQVTTD